MVVRKVQFHVMFAERNFTPGNKLECFRDFLMKLQYNRYTSENFRTKFCLFGTNFVHGHVFKTFPMTFSNCRASLFVHRREQHELGEKRMVECSICSFRSKGLRNLRKHMETHDEAAYKKVT